MSEIRLEAKRITPVSQANEIVSGYEKATKGGIVLVETRSLMEEIREEAARRIIAKGDARGVMSFLERLVEESLSVWLEYFPRIVMEMRKVNYEKRKIMQEMSNKGKFTDSYGWSPNRDFKWEYEHTPEFYFFMTNYVYADFFANENKRVYRRFMKMLMRGDDPIETLIRVKKIYGSNSQQESVVS